MMCHFLYMGWFIRTQNFSIQILKYHLSFRKCSLQQKASVLISVTVNTWRTLPCSSLNISALVSRPVFRFEEMEFHMSQPLIILTEDWVVFIWQRTGRAEVMKRDLHSEYFTSTMRGPISVPFFGSFIYIYIYFCLLFFNFSVSLLETNGRIGKISDSYPGGKR